MEHRRPSTHWPVQLDTTTAGAKSGEQGSVRAMAGQAAERRQTEAMEERRQAGEQLNATEDGTKQPMRRARVVQQQLERRVLRERRRSEEEAAERCVAGCEERQATGCCVRAASVDGAAAAF